MTLTRTVLAAVVAVMMLASGPSAYAAGDEISVTLTTIKTDKVVEVTFFGDDPKTPFLCEAGTLRCERAVDVSGLFGFGDKLTAAEWDAAAVERDRITGG